MATVMFSPKARLKRFVTPNWRVKPTAPNARMDAVTSPKPRLRTIWLTSMPAFAGKTVPMIQLCLSAL